MDNTLKLFSGGILMRRRCLLETKKKEMNLIDGTYLTCTYDVDTTSSPTQLLDAVELFDLAQVSEIWVDDEYVEVSRTHTFETTGVHTVIIVMEMSVFNSMYCMFRGCKRLTTIDFSHFDLSSNISFNCTFHTCVNLQKVDISGMDTSNVTSLAYMFWNDDDSIIHQLTTVNFKGCDFSNVTSMYGLFRGCHSLYEINFINITTSTKLTNCFAMFNCCYKVPGLYLGNINTTNVTNMSYMFGSCLDLTYVTFRTPINNLTTYSNVFYNIPTTGTLYYTSGYSFTKLINQLPSNWTAVAN